MPAELQERAQRLAPVDVVLDEQDVAAGRDVLHAANVGGGAGAGSDAASIGDATGGSR
jgi:hypothetical protein